jgi:hypothetical protein
VPLLFLALLLSIMVPQLDLLILRRKWLAPAITGIMATGILLTASLMSGFNASQPR